MEWKWIELSGPKMKLPKRLSLLDEEITGDDAKHTHCHTIRYKFAWNRVAHSFSMFNFSLRFFSLASRPHTDWSNFKLSRSFDLDIFIIYSTKFDIR